MSHQFRTGDRVRVTFGEHEGRSGRVYGFASDNRVGVDFDRRPPCPKLAAYVWADHVEPARPHVASGAAA